MPKVKLEHIDALSKGKKSGIRLGSRAVPHHLYAYEREEYERALKRWYLVVDRTDRVNLENLWMLVCESRGSEYLILRKIGERWVITSGSTVAFDGLLYDAKVYMKNLKLSKNNHENPKLHIPDR
jgi:hypothetical protein